MSQVWYHAGTGTYMPVEDCVVVEVPDDCLDNEDVESYLQEVDFEREATRAMQVAVY
jgi:hypothetical protein